MKRDKPTTSWESSGDWYDKIVGVKGHYYHEKIVLPKTLELLSSSKPLKLLDLACGQGVLARALPKNASYVGVELSSTLVEAAKSYNKNKQHQFLKGDITQELPIKDSDFTHATILLALQNIEDPFKVMVNAAKHLMKGGKLIIVMNHPCFRIPRQSSWGIDAPKKIQYRRIDRYFSPLKIPIQTHPSQSQGSALTYSFHHPLSAYSTWLLKAGFAIEKIEEWLSDKKSEGKTATMENRCRSEFPLFLTLLASKL